MCVKLMGNNFQKALNIKKKLELKKLNNWPKVIQQVAKHMV